MDKLGFVGLGAMGRPMAWNLRKAGFPLSVYNRSPEPAAAFAAEGVTVCPSPKATAGRSDITVVMVTGPDDLLAVLDGKDGAAEGLTKGKVLINMSTVSPEATAEAARLVEAKGAAFIDAPVSGTVKPAEEGTLVVLAGANDAAALRRAKPALLAMGKAVVECGKAGQGTQMKLVLNLLLGNMMQGLSEALMLGRVFGLDLGAVLDAVGGGAMNAPLFQMKGNAIREGRFASQFPVRLMHKDLNLVIDSALRHSLTLPQTSATRDCFTAAKARGLGNEDMAAVSRILEFLSGRQLRD